MNAASTPLKSIKAEDLSTKASRPPKDSIERTYTDELVIALCGPIGSPLHHVAARFKKALEERFGYDCETILLSEFIRKHSSSGSHVLGSYDRKKDLIEKGNDLRRKHGHSVLADLAIDRIAKRREKSRAEAGSQIHTPRRRCHIIDSIKNREELEVLRLVYRDMLYFVGVYSPIHLREASLRDAGMTISEVYRLIDRDSGEELDHGQTVRNTVPDADFFVRADEDSDRMLDDRIARFLDMVFETEISTPSAGETAMFQAAAAARNSACLSRQVGAAVTDS